MSCKRSYTINGILGFGFHCRRAHHPDEESRSPRRLRDSLRATDRTRDATGLDASDVRPLPPPFYWHAVSYQRMKFHQHMIQPSPSKQREKEPEIL